MAYQGYAEARAGLGLPEVPRAGRVVALLGETTRMRAFVAGRFHDAAVRHEVAAQNHKPAGVFDWIGKRAHHGLSRFFLRRFRFFVQGFQARRDLPAMQQARVEKTLGEKRITPGVVQINRGVVAPWLHVR